MQDRLGNVFLMAKYQPGDVTDIGGDDSVGNEVEVPAIDVPKTITTQIVLAVTAIFIAAIMFKG